MASTTLQQCAINKL